jgi:DNA-binding transcriptional LysR family regulator
VEIELRHLRHVLTLGTVGCFSKASRLLGIGQSALTRSIQSLERELGLRLFERAREGVVATPAGELFLERAEKLSRDLIELRRDLERAGPCDARCVRVGAGAIPRVRLVPRALATLSRRLPTARVELVLGSPPELIRALLLDDLELFVGECGEASRDPRLEVVQLAPRPAIWVCRAGHPLARRSRIALRDVARFPLAMPAIPSRLPGVVQALSETGWVECNDAFTLKEMLADSDFVGLQLHEVVERDLREGRIVTLPVEGPMPVGLPGIVWFQGKRLSPVASALIEALRDADREGGAAPPSPRA